MKTLLLLRHAKAKQRDKWSADDHERPLKRRGKREARQMGQQLRERELLPDLIICSSARRCRQTLEHVLQLSGYRGETHLSSEIFEASGLKLREVLSQLPDSCTRVLLIGHNPGQEELLASLTGGHTVLTTGALAQLDLPLERWSEINGDTRANLVGVTEPGG